MKKLLVFLKETLSKNKWYSVLLLGSSIYVFKYRADIYQLSDLNAQNLIFILWLALLVFPLFTEIEIWSVKLKKQIDETRYEVKESISELKTQISDISVATSTRIYNFNGYLPLSDKAELAQLENQSERNMPSQSNIETNFNIPDNNTYLFKVRLSLEKQLSALATLFQHEEHRSLLSMTNFLLQQEVISPLTSKLLRELINIANRGIHGEIIDDDYIKFVKKTYPNVKSALDNAYRLHSQKKHYCVCNKCGYRGPSNYSNLCPKCGFIYDD